MHITFPKGWSNVSIQRKHFLKKKKKNKKSFLNALSVLLSHNHRVSAFKSVCKLSTNVREPQTGNRILVGLRTVCFSCSSLCYAAVINVMTESNLGKKGLFGLQVLITVHHWQKPRQELKQDTWRHPAYWLLTTACLTCLKKPGPPTQGATTHSGLCPLTSIISKRMSHRFA